VANGPDRCSDWPEPAPYVFLKLTSHPSAADNLLPDRDDLILKFQSSIAIDSLTYLERHDGRRDDRDHRILVWIDYAMPAARHPTGSRLPRLVGTVTAA